jgi:2-methylisocitrate lyase-like PEP mutase family enzyme
VLADEEAGADVIFVEAPQNTEQTKRITRTIKTPVLSSMVEGGGKTTILPKGQLESLGFKIAIYPTAQRSGKKYAQRLHEKTAGNRGAEVKGSIRLLRFGSGVSMSSGDIAKRIVLY